MKTQAELTTAITEWFTAHLPEDLFTGDFEVTVDREEITIVGPIAGPARRPQDGEHGPDGSAGSEGTGSEDSGTEGNGTEGAGGEAGEAEETGGEESADEDGPTGVQAARDRAAIARAVKLFRETTRQERVGVAREAEHTFGRKVSWGVLCEGHRVMFTTFSVPVMTRLRQAERQVLDTLVDSGVARSRSDAVAWCVRLVGRHVEDWLGELREAVSHVERVRSTGPDHD